MRHWHLELTKRLSKPNSWSNKPKLHVRQLTTSQKSCKLLESMKTDSLSRNTSFGKLNNSCKNCGVNWPLTEAIVELPA